MVPPDELGFCDPYRFGDCVGPSSLRRNSEELQQVLSRMDQTAANFRTAQAAFVWDQYQKVVDEHDLQKGTVYFRRAGNEVQMAADITEPRAAEVRALHGQQSRSIPAKN